MASKRVVVTGAGGFVGSHLISVLSRIENVEILPLSRSVTPSCIQIDDYVNSPDGDILFHVAENANRREVNEDPTFQHASSRTISALIGRYGKIVYASSAAVYGDKEATPRNERASVFRSDSYNRMKLDAESLILGASNQNIVVRFSNLFGNGMSKNNVFSDLLQHARKSGSLILKSPEPVRDFLHVSDAVSATLTLGLSAESGIFNVGSGVGCSIAELAATISHALFNGSISISTSGANDQYSYNVLDISKIQGTNLWEPKCDLQTGIRSLTVGSS